VQTINIYFLFIIYCTALLCKDYRIIETNETRSARISRFSQGAKYLCSSLRRVILN